MRPNNSSKRLRGRSRSKGGGNPLSRSYESNGPDVKIRGSALQVADKYSQLARDAQSSGDRVTAENYFQHAEHYYRIVAAAYEQNGQPPRDRRDDERQRFDEYRQDSDRGRGEQPSINGYDGIEDEEEEGVRHAIRVNGAHHRARQEENAGEATRGEVERPAGDPEAASSRHAPSAAANGLHKEDERSEASQPRVDDASSDAMATDGEPAAEVTAEDGKPKPRRRTATRTRSRTRRTEPSSEASGSSPAEPEPTEPTS
ncbi:DUF4167 domain-containing protein [Acuticoccus sp.]|uniref:DUF4167 domain-containing protein n=1 Tax=Acuticoccus sp. TaxID=1904378 RepID=UPI003B52E70B